MRRLHTSRSSARGRPGKILVPFALLLPLLLGMVGLAIDGGLLLATYRQTQNAADTAALAAAMDLLHGQSTSTAQATATTYVQTYNNMSSATVTINIPPQTTSSPYYNNSQYAEAIISYPYTTSFIQLLGVNKSQSVSARAVAGYEPVTSGEGVITLQQNPQGGVGLDIQGSGILDVNGGIAVNASGPSALKVDNNGGVQAISVEVSGGAQNVTNGTNLTTYGGTGSSNLTTNTGSNYPDPLANLAMPTTSNGVVPTSYPDPKLTNGQSVTLNPGIYPSITSTGGTITFNPGIYVITGGGISLTGNNTVVNGSGVMFFNTASNYVPSSGGYTGGTPGTFGGITINTGNINLAGLTNASSPFDGMLFYQDRLDTQSLSIAGNSSATQLSGTTYAPQAQLSITGQGNYNSQFIIGSMTIAGGGTLTLNYAGQNLGKASEVFLVE